MRGWHRQWVCGVCLWPCLWLVPAMLAAASDDQLRQQLIDSWLGETDGASLSRRRLAAQGATQLARIDAVCQLSEPQRRKLELALEADLRRLDRAIEATREQLELLAPVGAELDKLRTDRELAQLRVRIISPLQQLRQGLWGNDSLLMAAQPAVLRSDQQTIWEADVGHRTRRLQQALITSWIIEQDRDLPLTDRHRRTLRSQLLESIRPAADQAGRAGNAIQAQLRQVQPESLLDIYSAEELAIMRRLERAAFDQFQQLQAADKVP
jgi:hypothetical protein